MRLRIEIADQIERDAAQIGLVINLRLAKVGTEPSEALQIIEALEPIFGAKDLQSGQELRFTLVPAPSPTKTFEQPLPLRVGDGLPAVFCTPAIGTTFPTIEGQSFDGTPITAQQLTQPEKGNLSAFNPDGSFTYEAPPGLPPARCAIRAARRPGTSRSARLAAPIR